MRFRGFGYFGILTVLISTLYLSLNLVVWKEVEWIIFWTLLSIVGLVNIVISIEK